MWLPAVLSLVLSSAPGDDTRTGAARCVTSCERHVSSPKLRTRVCGGCLLSPSSDRGAWALEEAAAEYEGPLEIAEPLRTYDV